MKSAIFCIILLTLSQDALAAENPCYTPGHFKEVPHDKPSTLPLSASAVRSFDAGAGVIAYDLGRETITITADSAASRHFLAEVSEQRCGAHATVKLTPDRKSPFNTHFTARRPH